MAPPNLDTLPRELVLHIMSYLEPREAAKIQCVSRKLWAVGRDGGFWRTRCFEESRFLASLERRQRLFGRGGGRSNGSGGGGGGSSGGSGSIWPTGGTMRPAERVRLMANWDLTNPSERVSWYDEYVQRYAPVAVNWFELPRRAAGGDVRRPRSDFSDVVEVCGVALYRPDGGRSAALLAVAPLKDGSVCLWDVNGTVRRRGAIVQRSVPGLLFPRDMGVGLAEAHFGVTNCITVDSTRHLAYIALRNYLVEVDLQTLTAVGVEAYPRPITALSAAHPSVPVSVGMAKGIHMHDTRARMWQSAAFKSVDDLAEAALAGGGSGGYAPYPPTAGPLSILHMPQAGGTDNKDDDDVNDNDELPSDDIYAAGRIPSILHYDRRRLPSIKGTIHSGASLCGLAAVPYPFSVVDHELRRAGQLSLAQAQAQEAPQAEASAGRALGRTLVACGEYRTKGSLELYSTGLAPDYQQNATMKNRQTSSSSKLFAVASHGTRLAVADGAGLVKWFERDGFTELRRCHLGGDDYDEDADSGREEEGEGHVDAEVAASNGAAAKPDAGDIARTLLPTGRGKPTGGNDLLFWTGEKLGLLTFSARPGFRSEDFVESLLTAEERAAAYQDRKYRREMRHLFMSAMHSLGDGDAE